MAPALVAPVAGSAAKDVKRESGTARLLGSGRYNCKAFNEQSNKRYAAGYKVLQRIYKYGGQPFVRDYLAKHYGTEFDNAFGKGTGKAIMHATAGSLIGIGEIVLLPLDVLKIKRQTNPEAFRGRGLFKIISDEGMGLYRGAGWTAARNAPGSFALFGGSAFAKEYLYKLTDYNQATWTQNFVASVAGASASLIVSAPLDVIKTRIQNRNFENPESGFRIVSSMIRNEGMTSFFKGLTPKLLMTGPKSFLMLGFRMCIYRNLPALGLFGLFVVMGELSLGYESGSENLLFRQPPKSQVSSTSDASLRSGSCCPSMLASNHGANGGLSVSDFQVRFPPFQSAPFSKICAQFTPPTVHNSPASFNISESRFGDPLFALFIGTSAAYIRIRREYREQYPDLPSDMVSILSLGKGRMVRWWNGYQ
ncbi:potential mitochondrial carrier protein Ggc1 [Uncinocarpus reesii 1704]|uniref:Potential mitochondrial carrier protein Ggc1 n=1 Tax=Uncinocarpus reesii (strain UAMH 1704) TaxID=336963 RepID=C4JPN8_UNCRE|nr:putative mitochondrial carrier protein Ggc1 [Uncinocarpus reesii 1704]EEP78364.1 potential mitochondrial carrier protein Ggc1 [Uncinocarpus reesii 1704]